MAPGSFPILGHVEIAKALATNELHKLYTKYAEAAGPQGLIRLCVAGDTRLICTGPEAFATLLRNKPFLPRPPALYDVLFMFGIKAHSVFTTPDAQEHARVRNHMMKFFNADNVAATIGRLEEQMAASTVAITAAFSAASAKSPGAPGQSGNDSGVFEDDVTDAGVLVNTFQFSATNILRVVFQVFLEVDLMPPLDTLNSTMQQATTVSAHPAQFQLLKRGLYPGHGRYRRNWRTLYEFHSELLKQTYAKPPPGKSTAFWATIRNAFPNAMSDEVQREAALSNLAFVYSAGYETTANATRHTLAALAIDQDSQEALSEELRDAGLLATTDNPFPPAITAEQLAGLSVLDAICHESLRVFTPAPGGGLRVLTKDTDVCGYRVPRGTTVMFPVWALHHNRHVWGTDALQWNPDRWLQGGTVAAVKKAADGNPRFLPFLDGPSNCIGQHLALVEVKMMVAAVVSRMHVTLDACMAHLRSVEDYVATTATHVTLQTEGPTWLRMRPRAAAADAGIASVAA